MVLHAIILNLKETLGKDAPSLHISDNTEIKIGILADDITLILQDLDSVENTIKTLKRFHKCSGLNINIEKKKYIYILEKYYNQIIFLVVSHG